jgi:hypothetical protein
LGSYCFNPVAWGQVAAVESSAIAAAKVVHPRNRVPLSFIIDDSTCLVNMGHFCMPQFAQAWPEQDIYRRPWKTWPREIPDSFVREFGQWCAEHGVKGKFSIVPYPACVGWLDRELPGWSRTELRNSLQLVRELMVPHWDIHPEMITHTHVIDLATGRPREPVSAATMENSFPQTDISVDELTSYLAYALRILKNCDLPCEGITTPGGFGNRVKDKLPLAVHEAVRDVYGTEIPHYFKYVSEGDESTQPTLEEVRDLDSPQPRLTVNVPAGTGDWFGGWDGDEVCQPDKYADPSATSGRMVELIERGEPAVMLCHWPGMYTHGSQQGFAALRQVVLALEQRFARQTLWMKPSEMARYWTAKELTRRAIQGRSIGLQAPFACPVFTLRLEGVNLPVPPRLSVQQSELELEQVRSPLELVAGTWARDDQAILVCIDLPRGEATITLGHDA